jgi:hypothetical protein
MCLLHVKWRSWNIHWTNVGRFSKFSSKAYVATDNRFLVPLLFIVPDVTLKLRFHWIRMPHNFPGKRRDHNTDWRTCVSHRHLLLPDLTAFLNCYQWPVFLHRIHYKPPQTVNCNPVYLFLFLRLGTNSNENGILFQIKYLALWLKCNTFSVYCWTEYIHIKLIRQVYSNFIFKTPKCHNLCKHICRRICYSSRSHAIAIWNYNWSVKYLMFTESPVLLNASATVNICDICFVLITRNTVDYRWQNMSSTAFVLIIIHFINFALGCLYDISWISCSIVWDNCSPLYQYIYSNLQEFLILLTILLWNIYIYIYIYIYISVGAV